MVGYLVTSTFQFLQKVFPFHAGQERRNSPAAGGLEQVETFLQNGRPMVQTHFHVVVRNCIVLLRRFYILF